jgi:hypothetical protein
MCGIIAWAGKKPGQFNKDKFNITGIINETRGEHSCGVTVDGEIQVGVGALKVYRDFVAADSVAIPKLIPTVIGHTRHATGGAHNIANAHPFGFGSVKDGGFAFVGVHNGSLLNHRDLAKEFGIDVTVGEGKDKRDKIDSEILLEIIYTTGNYKVLSKYDGAAALVWQYTEEPNVTYFYHGKSSTYEGGKTSTEERPLYYWKQNKNSLYVSSIEDSLFMIGGSANDIGEFEHNTVYKVKDGDVDRATKVKISRQGRHQKHGYGSWNSQTDWYQGHGSNSKIKATVASLPSVSTVRNSDDVNIYDEKPVQEGGSKIYFNKLRYWRNGHKINGCYLWISGYGFYFLAGNEKDAKKTFKSYTNKYFYDGGFYEAKDLSAKKLATAFIAFKAGGKYGEITNPPIYTFFDGIMMDHYLDYSACVGKEKTGRGFSITDLSKMAKHPIIDLTFAYREAAIQRIYLDGKLYAGTFCPLGSDKVYTVKAGNLTKMNIIPRPVTTIDLSAIKSEIEADLDKDKDKDKFTEFNKKTVEFVDDDLVEDDISKMFAYSYERFPDFKAQLEKYGTDRAKHAASILEDFLEATYELLTVEVKE